MGIETDSKGCGRDIFTGSKGDDKWCLVVVWVVILNVVLLTRIRVLFVCLQLFEGEFCGVHSWVLKHTRDGIGFAWSRLGLACWFDLGPCLSFLLITLLG